MKYDKLTDDERLVLIDEARKLVGTPWRHQGRTVAGADCIGFGWLVYAATLLICRGITLDKPRSDYGRTPSGGKLRAELVEWLGDPVDREPIPGDIVTIKWAGDERHLGIIVPHPQRDYGMIHGDNTAAGAEGPRVVEHGMDARWRARIVEVWAP